MLEVKIHGRCEFRSSRSHRVSASEVGNLLVVYVGSGLQVPDVGFPA